MLSTLLPMLAEAGSAIGDRGLAAAGAGIGMGIAVLGGGRGIGQIGGQACEAIARQPESSGRIGTNMIISAALIEGFTFTAIILAFVLANKIH